MITYTLEENSAHTDEILQLLRIHNGQFTNNKDAETYNIYIVDGEHLIAAAIINYNWDWVSIGKLFYFDTIGLKHILKAIIERYKNKAVGIKFFTNDKHRLIDVISIGFEATGMYKEEATRTTWYYANFYTFDKHINGTYTVIAQTESIDKYDLILKQHVSHYNSKHNIKDKLTSFNIVALDQNRCIGGVTCDVYEKTLYIPYLAVDKKYRTLGIGTNLMKRVEEESKQRNVSMIDLGTSDFQAKGFYEKLGYETVYTQKNQPRGYNTYTMIKVIK
ncbi:MAG: GNAT family N-acetyltransferase [Bacillota bacterium]